MNRRETLIVLVLWGTIIAATIYIARGFSKVPSSPPPPPPVQLEPEGEGDWQLQHYLHELPVSRKEA